MFTRTLATASDVGRLLGDVDPLITARILAIAPTRDELNEAVRETEDEVGFGEQPRDPSSARVANIRAVLVELIADDLDSQMEQAR
ncbi:hypothetical protein BH11MYX3_BH11MYX3_12030 [soil metagenome]